MSPPNPPGVPPASSPPPGLRWPPCSEGLATTRTGRTRGRAIYLLDVVSGEVDKPGNLKLKEWAPLGPPEVIPKEARVPFGNKPLAHAMGYPLAPLTGFPIVPEAPNSRLQSAR